MLTTDDLIEFGENLMVADDTPPSVQAAVYRTVLEMRGFIGAKASKSLAGDESEAYEKTYEQLQQELRDMTSHADDISA